ncbi:MAG: 50S ribosomal protein L32 [Anaerolineaceae bacterium 4572_78]|nr:MAG: 50S ribosomal protein L32 [Anaerolineaceae bacterium 4572_78]
MGPLPKRRISRRRQANKRARYLRIKMPHLIPCPECNILRIAHTVCMNCGKYKGKEIIPIEEKTI